MKTITYDSSMNKLSFGKFKEKELDLFFSICYKMKNKGTNDIKLSFQELKELSQYQNRNLERFIKDLENTYSKLIDIKIRIEKDNIIDNFVLFTRYRIDKNNKDISIRVNDEYLYILNDITNYTKFDLMEFIELKSIYSKNMFKILKQYESNNQNEKWFEIKLDKLKELLNIPKSYQMCNIDKMVLRPIIEQLKPIFTGLKIEKIKKGVRIDKLRFTWKDKKRAKKEKAIKEAKELFNKAIADKRTLEVEKEVQELEKQAQKPLEQNTIIQREKITSKAYESKYKEYLKVLGVEHNTFIRKSFDIINKPLYEIIEDTENKIKIKPQEIKTKYQEFLNKYNCDDNPIMKKAFDEILEKEYIIDLKGN